MSCREPTTAVQLSVSLDLKSSVFLLSILSASVGRASEPLGSSTRSPVKRSL